MCWSLELHFPSAHVSSMCLWNLVCRRAACSFLEWHTGYGVISAVDSLSFGSSLEQPLQIPDLLPCLSMASLTSVMQVLMVCQFMPRAARKGRLPALARTLLSLLGSQGQLSQPLCVAEPAASAVYQHDTRGLCGMASTSPRLHEEEWAGR